MDEANNTAMDVEPVTPQQAIGALPSRRTLRIVNYSDIHKIYQYLETYTQDPTNALHVEEVLIDTQAWPKSTSRAETDTVRPAPTPDEVARHDCIKAYIRTIGLSDATTTHMLESLDWKFNGSIPLDYYGYKNLQGYAAAATVILLSLCKNLTHLHAYGIEYTHYIQDFLLLNNYAKLPSPSLQNLQHVLIDSYRPSDEREYDRAEFLKHFRYFGRLPSIQSYTANACMAYQIDRDVTPPGTSNIRKIAITNADIDSFVLGSIIRAPKALEEFTFSAGGLSHFGGGSPLVWPKTLGKCLLEHKSTLKILDMDMHGALLFNGPPEEEDRPDPYEMANYNEEYPDPRIDEYFLFDQANGNGRPVWSEALEDTRVYGFTMGSLHDYEALERLSVPMVALMGPPRPKEGYGPSARSGRDVVEPPFRLVDGLPPNLRSLRLYDYRKGVDPVWDEYVDELKEKVNERFPLLEELVGVDEPLVGNSKYGVDAGYNERNPPPQVLKWRERW